MGIQMVLGSGRGLGFRKGGWGSGVQGKKALGEGKQLLHEKYYAPASALHLGTATCMILAAISFYPANTSFKRYLPPFSPFAPFPLCPLLPPAPGHCHLHKPGRHLLSRHHFIQTPPCPSHLRPLHPSHLGTATCTNLVAISSAATSTFSIFLRRGRISLAGAGSSISSLA